MFFRITKLVFALLIASAIGISQITLSEPAWAHDESEVTYQNGPITIAATLLKPKGSGPFPAVVVVHGSGSSTRSNAWTSAYVNALVKRGVAVLYPDKRGSGKSTGSWLTASFLDLSDPKLARSKGYDPSESCKCGRDLFADNSIDIAEFNGQDRILLIVGAGHLKILKRVRRRRSSILFRPSGDLTFTKIPVSSFERSRIPGALAHDVDGQYLFDPFSL